MRDLVDEYEATGGEPNLPEVGAIRAAKSVDGVVIHEKCCCGGCTPNERTIGVVSKEEYSAIFDMWQHEKKRREELEQAPAQPEAAWLPKGWRDVIDHARNHICPGGLAENRQHEESIVLPHLDGVWDELEALEADYQNATVDALRHLLHYAQKNKRKGDDWGLSMETATAVLGRQQ